MPGEHRKMKKEYWLERWRQEEIGFHQSEINPYLRQYWPDLQVAPGKQVFIPLCGKSRDMIWLREQNLSVLGVELSPLAVEAFFKENEYSPRHNRPLLPVRLSLPLAVRRTRSRRYRRITGMVSSFFPFMKTRPMDCLFAIFA